MYGKKNWEETKQHFLDWWDHKGLVVGMWGPGIAAVNSLSTAVCPGDPASPEQRFTDAAWRSAYNHHTLSRNSFPLDSLPFSETDLGPGSLSIYLGSEPGFSDGTIWFHPTMTEATRNVPLGFDAQQKWWRVQEELIAACGEKSGGEYFVGIPDLTEGMDILGAIQNTQEMMLEMLEDPDWVKRKLDEIETAWFEVYRRIYDRVHIEGQGTVFRAFCLWSPGKVAKVQCDLSLMLSPDMFREFAVPYLEKQCNWLDHSMYHLDGTGAVMHLDDLLQIENLNAIEWTPEAGLPGGADKRWHEMYRRILDVGKSIQAVYVKPDEVAPLLDAIGPKGVYLMVLFENEQQCEEVAKVIERYR